MNIKEIDEKLWNRGEYDGRQRVYAMAFDLYGCEAQRLVAVEEMAELTKELCKIQREGTTMERLVDEIADVSIMVEQLIMMFGVEKAVRDRMHGKVDRLEKRIIRDVEELGWILISEGGSKCLTQR